MIPLNLVELFGDRYRITFDEAYNPSHVPRAKLDPWMMQIPCRGRGITIYPHGGNVLAIEVDHRRNIAKALAALPGLKLWQDGDEMTFLFDVALFPAVAEIVKPKRRPQYTAEQRDANRRRLANYAFRSAQELTKSTAG
jgi:hypothetical protein